MHYVVIFGRDPVTVDVWGGHGEEELWEERTEEEGNMYNIVQGEGENSGNLHYWFSFPPFPSREVLILGGVRGYTVVPLLCQEDSFFSVSFLRICIL